MDFIDLNFSGTPWIRSLPKTEILVVLRIIWLVERKTNSTLENSCRSRGVPKSWITISISEVQICLESHFIRLVWNTNHVLSLIKRKALTSKTNKELTFFAEQVKTFFCIIFTKDTVTFSTSTTSSCLLTVISKSTSTSLTKLTTVATEKIGYPCQSLTCSDKLRLMSTFTVIVLTGTSVRLWSRATLP